MFAKFAGREIHVLVVLMSSASLLSRNSEVRVGDGSKKEKC
jgi:hypothetical protein